MPPTWGGNSVLLGQRGQSLYQAIAEALRATRRFGRVSILDFDHDVVYPTEAWLELTVTHSDHRTLPPSQLAKLVTALRGEIDRNGGRVPVRYESSLVTGRTLDEGSI